MKTNHLLLTAFISLFFVTTTASAQSYGNGIGLRFGGLTTGFTLKHFTNANTALEGIVSVGHQNFIITGLYEKYTPIENSKLLNLYYGIGAHVGFFQEGGRYYYNDHRVYNSATVAGIDGILGIDYKFKDAPINIGMDFKPFVDFYNGSTLYFDGGISLRYTF